MYLIGLKEFLDELDSSLNSAGIQYAVARNSHSLPYSFTGNDIDLLVSGIHQKELISVLFCKFRHNIFRVVEKSSVTHVFFMNIQNNSSIFLQIDFIFSFHFRGASFLESQRVLCNRMRQSGLWVLTDLDSMAVVFVTKGIIHLSVPDKYKKQISALPRNQLLSRINKIAECKCISKREYLRALANDLSLFQELRYWNVRSCWLLKFQQSLNRLFRFCISEFRAALPDVATQITVVSNDLLDSDKIYDVMKGSATELILFEGHSLLKFYFQYWRPSRRIKSILISESFATKLYFHTFCEVKSSFELFYVK